MFNMISWSALPIGLDTNHFQGRPETGTDLGQWTTFVSRFYAPGGVLRQGVYNPQAGSKQFEIATPALARYYHTQCTSGICHIQMVVDGARERDSPSGVHIVESSRTCFIYWFTNGTQVCMLDFPATLEMPC